mmetsp:Transcript_11927/g.29378  ORF Transcript_11927/g.29378 Transcript_11927/m.29378 type:complete len:562 (-) Transcript_11927:192-1877(-)
MAAKVETNAKVIRTRSLELESDKLHPTYRKQLESRYNYIIQNKDISDSKLLKEKAGIMDNVFIVLPETCVAELGLTPNINDKGEPKKIWFGRLWQLRLLDLLRYRQKMLANSKTHCDDLKEAKETVKDCLKNTRKLALVVKAQAIWRAKIVQRAHSFHVLNKLKFTNVSGFIVFLHGSGGMTVNNMRYVRMWAAMGYVVIAPDNMSASEFRHRDSAGLFTIDDDLDYWSKNLVYTSGTEGEHAYSTKSKSVLEDPVKYKDLYEEVFRTRAAELGVILDRLPVFIRRRGVFLAGTSEGAMTIARYNDRRHGKLINGRIISAFNVEYCYFTPHENAARFGGSKKVPTLNIIGDDDPYFGPYNSVAAEVAKDKKTGYGKAKITGNAFETMVAQGMHRGLTVVLEGGKHDPTITHDNFLRDLFSSFLSAPQNCGELHLQWGCDKFLSSQIKVNKFIKTEKNYRLLHLNVKKAPHSPYLSYREVETLRRGNIIPKEELERAHKLEEINVRSLEQERAVLFKRFLNMVEKEEGKHHKTQRETIYSANVIPEEIAELRAMVEENEQKK